jgi:hypothetical protein
MKMRSPVATLLQNHPEQPNHAHIYAGIQFDRDSTGNAAQSTLQEPITPHSIWFLPRAERMKVSLRAHVMADPPRPALSAPYLRAEPGFAPATISAVAAELLSGDRNF